MNILEIRKLPTLYNDVKTGQSHESLLRAYQILERVKEWLGRESDPKLILELIHLMEGEGGE